MGITRAVVVREALFLIVLLAAVIGFQTFLSYLVTNRINLGVIAVYVVIRLGFLAAKGVRPT